MNDVEVVECCQKCPFASIHQMTSQLEECGLDYAVNIMNEGHSGLAADCPLRRGPVTVRLHATMWADKRPLPK